jgi:hypothetical protein
MMRIAVFAVASLPMLWLFDLTRSPAGDWNPAVWAAGYMGEYFYEHGAFAIELNTDKYVGMMAPIYYGFLFQPLAGLVSSMLGGDLAIRFLAVVSFLVAQFQVYATVCRITSRPAVALAVTTLSAFEIYPMTQIYSLGHVAEFVARAWLLSAACIWLRSLIDPQPISRRKNLAMAGLCLAIAVGTHPIYAVQGSVLALGAVAVTLAMRRDRLVALGELATLAAWLAVVLSPWLFLLRRYPPTMVSIELPIYVSGVDNALVRLLPFPFGSGGGTEHLDTQVSVPLLIGCLGFGIVLLLSHRDKLAEFRTELSVAACCLVGAAAFFMLSVNVRAMALAPFFFWTVQYVYRLAALVDLLLLMTLCFLLLAFRRAHLEPPAIARGAIWATIIAVAFVSLSMKLAEVPGLNSRVPGTALFDDRSSLTHNLPETSMPTNYASNVDLQDELPAAVTARVQTLFPVGTGKRFGEPLPVEVPLPNGRLTAVTTDAIAFPWNRLSASGKPLPKDQIFAIDAPLGGAARLLEAELAEGPVTIGFVLVPDPVWMVLRAVSFAAILLWIVVSVVLVVCSRRLSYQRLP